MIRSRVYYTHIHQQQTKNKFQKTFLGYKTNNHHTSLGLTKINEGFLGNREI